MDHQQSSTSRPNPSQSETSPPLSNRELSGRLSNNLQTRALPTLTMKEFLLWLMGRRRRFRVNGPSMLPLLQPGDEVLVNSYDYKNSDRTPIPGEVVIVQHPQQPELRMVKRVVSIEPNPSLLEESSSASLYYWIEGDNPLASTDSRSFGAVPLSCILGTVTVRFS